VSSCVPEVVTDRPRSDMRRLTQSLPLRAQPSISAVALQAPPLDDEQQRRQTLTARLVFVHSGRAAPDRRCACLRLEHRSCQVPV
jgi:hypothetical protein